MKKEWFRRGLLGFPLGIALGFVISIGISAWMGDGSFYPVTPQLAETMGGELNAVIVQTVLCGVLGAGFAMASVIWEMDSWSLARQSGVYFAAVCALMLPIAYITNWMEHTISGVLIYVGIFAGIFAAVWLIQYAAWKQRIRKMNDRLKKGGGAA